MGIPSYYKKLADHIKGLVGKSVTGKPNALYFDFNCMIYHCARRSNSKLPPYPGPDGKEEWENLLLTDITKYIVKVWQDVQQPKEVFLAVDGVVPMAKIKQQRLRRFKSIWLAEQEKKEGIRENVASWDTNCITPGTAFMRKLSLNLKTLCGKHTNWSYSGAEEPGEGEHKIMNKLRKREPTQDPILIYGLDADLILLTMLNARSPAYLVRETSEMGSVQLNSFGEEEFSYFSLEELKKTLPPKLDIVTYVTAMSLLGNDFLPHSLTMKVREDGHPRLLKSLAECPYPLVLQEEGFYKVNHQALLHILKSWSNEEEKRVLTMLKHKLQMKGRTQMSLENRPLEWNVEQGLAFKQQDEWKIHPAWRTIYRKDWLRCESKQDIQSLCREYIFGIQWVLDYYTGQRPVHMGWSFSRLLPPLWDDLVQFLEGNTYEPIPLPISTPIQPKEQLAMVLPLESWHLMDEPSLRSLPRELPQFWPEGFGFFSVGRTRLWECEALLPVLTVERIRNAVKV